MNPAVTQCPACSTRFKVTTEQLAAHDGMVRCGRCDHVFDAAAHFHNGDPSPQLDLPIGDISPSPEFISTIRDSAQEASDTSVAEVIANEPEAPLHHFRLPVEEDIPLAEVGDSGKSSSKTARWPWITGSSLLLLILLAQVLYFQRVEIAARLPGLKPLLTAYCDLLQCSIPLPKKAELMSIESSDLEADPQLEKVITLNALLHNRAPYTQAYPSLELSLTDLEDRVVARRTFTPSEYLKTVEDEKKGFAANREIIIKLRLDTADIQPAGYKLYLF
jgi:predicted Zn finger-like uncharacterized protein